MKRCVKCLMPVTIVSKNPDTSGECVWCRSQFPNYRVKGREHLIEILDRYRSGSDAADCMVGISGGKDSCYTALALKMEFAMKVEAFTYVHEGTAPIALENAKKVCSALSIPLHMVSLNNNLHLKTFKHYFYAWHRNPTPVTAAMICVACKHLHFMGCALAAKRRIPMMLWSQCPLEYSPFTAIALKTQGAKQLERSGMLCSALKLSAAFGRSALLLGGFIQYFHTSLVGCLSVSPTSAFLRFRYPSLHHLFFYEYIPWEPLTIVESLQSSVRWKNPAGSHDDWHSDCLFNVFKEYVFQKMFGISYTDSFLSNRIRFGLLTRREAMDTLVASKHHFKDALRCAVKRLGITVPVDYACFEIEG